MIGVPCPIASHSLSNALSCAAAASFFSCTTLLVSFSPGIGASPIIRCLKNSAGPPCSLAGSHDNSSSSLLTSLLLMSSPIPPGFHTPVFAANASPMLCRLVDAPFSNPLSFIIRFRWAVYNGVILRLVRRSLSTPIWMSGNSASIRSVSFCRFMASGSSSRSPIGSVLSAGLR